MTDRAKRCPFCSHDVNNHALSRVEHPFAPVTQRESDKRYHVSCVMCAAKGPAEPTVELAIREWNGALRDRRGLGVV